MLRLLVPATRAPAEGGFLDVSTRPGRAFGRLTGSARSLARHQLAVPAAIGFVGSCLASIAATHRGGMFLISSDPWFFRVPPFAGGSHYPSLVAFYFGAALLVGAWLAVVRAARAPDGPTVRPVLIVMAIWALPLLVGPPLFSGDVFIYAADGQLVNHGLNPYATTPYALGPSQFRGAAHGLWLHTVSPYGPLFLRLAGVASTIGFHTVVGTVIVFRVLACAGLALAAVSLCAISRRHGQRPAHVMALTMLSPLTLFHLVSAGHNDAIMLGLLAAGVALASAGRPMSGIALCTLAAAVKLPAAIAVLFIVWALVRDLPTLRARIATLARGGAVALGTIAAATAASGLSWGWLGALGVPGVAAPRLAVVNDLAFGFDHPLGLQFVTLLHLARDLGMVLAVVAICYLLLHSRRAQAIPALGAALIVAAVLGPTFYPWYLTWGLMLVAASAADRWERALLWANVVPTFAVAPGGEGWLDQAAKRAGTWIARSVVGAVVVAAAITIYRPRRVVDLFRATPDRLVPPAPPAELEPVPSTPSTDGAIGNGHVAPAAPDGLGETEPVVS